MLEKLCSGFSRLASTLKYGEYLDEEEVVGEFLERVRENNLSSPMITGVVTQVALNSAEIDRRYVFPLTQDKLKIGDNVKYRLVHRGPNVEVRDVVLVANKNSQSFKGWVVSVQRNLVTVDPGNIEFNTAIVDVDFVPRAKDLVNLYGTFPVDAPISVERVEPHETKSLSGQIRFYDKDTNSGVISNDIAFEKEDCEGFLPCPNCFVFCSVISIKDDRYKWRATKVIMLNKKSPRMIEVTSVPFFNLVVGEHKEVEFHVFNTSQKPFNIESVQVTPQVGNITVVDNYSSVLLPKGSLMYKVSCKGDSIGKTSANIVWVFNNCKVTRLINFDTTVYNARPEAKRTILPGRNKFIAPKYVNVKIMNYILPSGTEDIPQEMTAQALAKVQMVFPKLGEDVSKENYKEIMHSLLFLEEISLIEQMKQLTNSFCLYAKQDMVVLNFEADSLYSNLAPGDGVCVSKPWEEIEYHGKIWETSGTQAFIKLHPQFMSDYRDGALYHVSFIYNRMQMRMRHFAVDAVVKYSLIDRIFLQPLNKHHSESDINYWYNPNLNQEQKNAVRSIISQQDKIYPYIIFGPPGTGKTVTVVELIMQLWERRERMIVTAPTNSAINVIALKIIECGVKKNEVIRLCSYNSYKQGNIPLGLVDVSFVPSLFEEIPSFTSEQIPYCTRSMIEGCRILLSTLSCTGVLCSLGLTPGFFSHVIIDECGEATEPETLIPVTFLNRSDSKLILAGDPQQLGPVVFSPIASHYGFDMSLLVRLSKSRAYAKDIVTYPETLGYNKHIVTKLIRNYRSLPALVKMTSDMFYDKELIPMISSKISQEASVLKSIVIQGQCLEDKPVVFVDVDGTEEQAEGSHSWFNTAEVMRVVLLLNELYKTISPDSIGVVTPYSLQAKMIHKYLEDLGVNSPKIGSVEEFQGAERDVIIFTVVRNSRNKRIPEFISNYRKVNVALSRAKILNIIVGSLLFLSNDRLWQTIIDSCHKL